VTGVVHYRLGAEELLELGRRAKDPRAPGRSPFLAGRMRMAQQGAAAEPEKVYILDVLGNVAGWIAQGLSFAFNTLGDLVNIPLNILSQGVDVTFNGVAGLLKNIPVIGDLLAQILVLGGSLVKFGLSIPGLALHGLGNVMGGIAKALKGSGDESQNQKKVDDAKKNIVDQAPAALKKNVQTVLDSSGVTGNELTPNVEDNGTPKPASPEVLAQETVPAEGTDLGTVLAVGIPVVGAAAIVAAVA
jgi:hypothetical protein